MIEGGDGAGFLFEALASPGVGGEFLGEDLEGNVAAEAGAGLHQRVSGVNFQRVDCMSRASARMRPSGVQALEW